MKIELQVERVFTKLPVITNAMPTDSFLWARIKLTIPPISPALRYFLTAKKLSVAVD